jgi:hypothetical protein
MIVLGGIERIDAAAAPRAWRTLVTVRHEGYEAAQVAGGKNG